MARKIYAHRRTPIWRHSGASKGWARARKDTWQVPDKGKTGRTPWKKQWSKDIKVRKSHKIEGYKISRPWKKRKAALNKEVNERAKYGAARYDSKNKQEEGALSTKRTLQMIANKNPRREADRTLKKDIRYLERKYGV